MKLTKEDTIKAIELCFSRNGCGECPLGCPDEDCSDLLLKNALHYLKENEPAPSANDTSSNHKNITTLDDTAKLEICQEALIKIGDRIVEVEGDTYILGYVHAVLKILGGKND